MCRIPGPSFKGNVGWEGMKDSSTISPGTTYVGSDMMLFGQGSDRLLFKVISLA